MAERVRPSQEEEIIEMLEREGFEELTEQEVGEEPYRSIYMLPECFKPEQPAPLAGDNTNEGESRS
jgi:hypothetical protein